MANVVHIYKQDEKQNVKNYRPVSLLPIFEKKYLNVLNIQGNVFIFYRKLISPN